MKNVSSTNQQKLNKLSKIFLHIFISFILMAGFSILSSVMNQRNSEGLLNSVQAMFRNDKDVGNTAHLGRRIADLEYLHIIKCVDLNSETFGKIYSTDFKEGCENSIVTSIVDPLVVGDITSLEGDHFSISFRSDSSFVLKLYIAMFFLLSLIIGNSLIAVYWYRLDLKAKALLKEQEEKRILDVKVQEQAAELVDVKLEAAVQKSNAILSKRVAHDIRSPLMALNAVIKRVTGVDDEYKNMLVEVSSRINGIANELLTLAKTGGKEQTPVASSTTTEATFLKSALGKVIREKALEYHNNSRVILHLRADKIEDSTKINFPEKDFARILSNLINNSVEAVVEDGNIYIESFLYNGQAIVRIQDAGHGMSEELKTKLLTESITTKAQGSGIGLSSARTLMQSNGGNLKITSKEGMGTQITLTFQVT